MIEIFSPIPDGSGACIVHQALCQHIEGYQIKRFNPKIALFPPLLHLLGKDCRVLHTIPECGDLIFQRAKYVVVTVHNFYIDDEYIATAPRAQQIYYRLVLRPLVTRALLRANRVVAVSDYTAGLVRRYFPDTKVEVIKNCVNEKQFFPPQARNNQRIKVLFSGNPSQRKGRQVLLQLADQLPATAELIVTAGLRNKTNLRHNNIKVIKYVNHEQMAALYRSVDILLLPSYREGLSLAVLEAMASGLPVVGFDSSSMAELIDDQKGGYLSPVNDFRALLRALERLITATALRQDQGLYNRERIVRYFFEHKMVKEYSELFTTMDI